MSLYNMLFGINPQTPLLLACLGFKKHDVPRLRDVFVDGDRIAVYTRMGGVNRGHWDSYDDEPGRDCLCPGCRADHVLARHDLFEYGEDGDYDSTYRTFYFRFPKGFERDVPKLNDILGNGITKKFGQFLLKTLRREPTEADRSQAAYDAECAKLKKTAHFMANGHTFVPRDDAAMKVAP